MFSGGAAEEGRSGEESHEGGGENAEVTCATLGGAL